MVFATRESREEETRKKVKIMDAEQKQNFYKAEKAKRAKETKASQRTFADSKGFVQQQGEKFKQQKCNF